jgi:cystathionine beta-lyase
MHVETKLVQIGVGRETTTGAVSFPIHHSTTYRHSTTDHQSTLEQSTEFDYSRTANPTRQVLEEAIAEIEGGDAGFAFASGMAAISSVFLLFSSGDHLIVAEDVYGGTYRVLTRILSRLGIEVTFVDTTCPERVEAAIRPNTKAIYLETPSNPTLKVTSLPDLCGLARVYGLLTIVDNTFLTPYYQRPLDWGADIVIHSATKFIAGHSDVVAGLVVTRDETLGEQLYTIQNGFGAVLGVQDSWLVLRGLKTLKARLDVSTASAGTIARWLEEHPLVERVFYTGLPSHPGHEVQQRQASGHGAVLSFDVGSRERAKALFDTVKLPLVAVSLGAVESILSYPAMMSHAAMPPEERLRRGITDGLIRLSVGLEDVNDLIADLDQALKAARAVPVTEKIR